MESLGSENDKVESQKIWRYMDFPKFINLLETKKLCFSRADSFKDVFEGKIPEFFFRGWPEEKRKSYEETYYWHIHSEKKTFINCWSAHEKESYALWQIYGGSGGIALQSSIGALKSSFEEAAPDIVKVKYIDYSAENSRKVIPVYSDSGRGIYKRNFFTCKPKAYEYENEVRAILMETHEEQYKLVPVVLDRLIAAIYISPFSEEWFIEMVANMVRKRYGLNKIRIMMSDIELEAR